MKIRAIVLALIIVLSVFALSGETPAEAVGEKVLADEFHEVVVIDQNTEVSWIGRNMILHRGLTVNGTLAIINSTITLNVYGIGNYGNLNIFNSTIFFNGSNVYNVGTFNVTDHDGDPSTNNDASDLIFNNGIDNNFYNHHGDQSIVNINRSYLEGASIYRGSLDLHGLVMNNCSIRESMWSSSFRDLKMVGNGTGVAFIVNSAYIPIDDISVSNYPLGLRLPGTMEHRNLSIQNCWTGIMFNHGTPVIKESRFVDNDVHISTGNNITLNGVEFINGTINFSPFGVTAIQNCRFTGLDRISNITNGVVRRSTFTDCVNPINNVVNTIILENYFIGSTIAVENTIDCRIYHNSFIDNIRIVSGPPLSTWYNETLEEGNYYDIYSGLDDGSSGRRADDGIGDTQLIYLSRDPFPLMQDQHWNMPRLPELDIQYEGGSDTVNIDWDPIGSNFIIQRSTSLDFSTHLVAWSVSDSELIIENNPNATLYFRVRGYNSYGSRGWSNIVNVLVNQMPLAPTNIKVDPIPEGESLLVTWEWQGEDVDRGMILIRRGGIDLNPQIVYRSENAHVIRDLDNFIQYTIGMISIDQSGLNSDLSETVNATPIDQVPPPPPRRVRAITKGNESIAIEWDPPLTQDLWGYIIYRRDPGQSEFDEITRLSKGVLYFEDMNLKDNTTYEYALSSVDDDGPVSGLSSIAMNTTLHFNHRPVFSGSELILYLIEDEGPLSSDILKDFSDQDGDDLTFSIVEFFPFRTTISKDVLWVIPELDQAGEGYVQIKVSDGEESVPYLIGIIVEPVDDPPRDISILYPINGSVLLPGAPVTLEASGYDPDTDQGDVMNVTWSSDIEGILHISTQSNLRAIVELRTGIHVLELRVEDRTGNTVVDQVTVVVSLWGWGEMPWAADFQLSPEKVNSDLPLIMLDLTNDSPLVLRFNINGNMGETRLSERNILVGPKSQGSITIQLPFGLEPGNEIEVILEIDTQTLNGTYGGTQEISRTFRVEGSNGSSGETGAMVAVIVIISIFALLGVGAYIFYMYRLKARN